MPQVYDKKTDAAKIARDDATKEASKKKDLVKAGAPVEEQEKALVPQKAAAKEKAPDPKAKAAKADADKKTPQAPEKTAKKATEAAEKKADFWPVICDLQHAAAAAEAGKIKNEADLDKHITAGHALAKSLEDAKETFTHKCEVRDAIAQLVAAKEALKAPPPPDEAVTEVVAEAEQKEMPPEAALVVAAKAKSLVGGASEGQAEKLGKAAKKVETKAMGG